jgi:hypothetical protein
MLIPDACYLRFAFLAQWLQRCTLKAIASSVPNSVLLPQWQRLNTSQIQEIQLERIKNIITCISLENMGETQVDVRQRPGYKAAVL